MIFVFISEVLVTVFERPVVAYVGKQPWLLIKRLWGP